MAIDPNNLSSSPLSSGYMSNDQIQQLYDYSKQLTKGGMRDDTITSPWQGVRMMADALAGNYLRNKAGQQQIQNKNLEGKLNTDVWNSAFPQSNALPYPNITGSGAPSPAPVSNAQPSPPVKTAGGLPGLPPMNTAPFQYPGITGSGMPAFAGQPSMSGGIGNSMMPPLMTPPPGSGTGLA